MGLDLCTLTGADEKTPLAKLWELSDRFPFVEWGILYSESRQGQGGRYPSFDWIEKLVIAMKSHPKAHFALHVCGRATKDFIAGTGHVHEIQKAFGRIQLNLKAENHDIMDLRKSISEDHASQIVITQHNQANEALWAQMADLPNHAVLFDSSGGLGVSPKSWLLPLPFKRCGYAGGLGPDNLAEQLQVIHSVANNVPYWIDMEGKLRIEDHFDLKRAEKCLVLVNEFLTKNITHEEIYP